MDSVTKTNTKTKQTKTEKRRLPCARKKIRTNRDFKRKQGVRVKSVFQCREQRNMIHRYSFRSGLSEAWHFCRRQNRGRRLDWNVAKRARRWNFSSPFRAARNLVDLAAIFVFMNKNNDVTNYYRQYVSVTTAVRVSTREKRRAMCFPSRSAVCRIADAGEPIVFRVTCSHR